MKKVTAYLIAFIISTICIKVYSQEYNISDNSIFLHTVESGQTVYSIATMYGVTVESIYRLNPDSRETIKIGEALRIPQQEKAPSLAVAQEDNYIFHTIQPKETLYSLTIRYGIPAEAILEANPGLSTATFQIGKTIRIPNSVLGDIPLTEFRTVINWIDYTVPRRETLYNITRKFNIPADELIRINPQLREGVKEGMVIRVPVQTDEPVKQQAAPRERDVNALLNTTRRITAVNSVKIALMLPFMAEEAPSAATTRFIEYYEGMLLAVDSLKKSGINIELSVYDTGDGLVQLNRILEQDHLKGVNLIIGGAAQNDQISRIGAFAEEHQIKYVIPFTSRNDEVLSNAWIYQVNTPHSYLYAKAARAGADIFREYNIVILNTPDKDEKTEFIQAFKTELQQRNIGFREVSYDAASFVENMNGVLSTEKRNLILPTSSSLDALNKFMPTLRGYMETHADYTDRITLFGYPDWQTYTQHFLEEFYALDTYIYSNFYADYLSRPVQSFYTQYKTWFSKIPGNTFPKYSMLGFDTGMFFIRAIQQYGTNFENNLDRISYIPLQTGFDFQRVNNWGGFVNTNIFIVHYNKNDLSITRTEIK